MFIKGLLIAGAAGLISSAALAQDHEHALENSAQSPTTVNPKPTTGMAGTSAMASPSAATGLEPAMPAPSASAAARDVVAVSPDQARAQGMQVQVVASAPVPDTAENRAKFGAPLSMMGKRTAAKGN